jgi:hypothetical protein
MACTRSARCRRVLARSWRRRPACRYRRPRLSSEPVYHYSSFSTNSPPDWLNPEKNCPLIRKSAEYRSFKHYIARTPASGHCVSHQFLPAGQKNTVPQSHGSRSFGCWRYSNQPECGEARHGLQGKYLAALLWSQRNCARDPWVLPYGIGDYSGSTAGNGAVGVFGIFKGYIPFRSEKMLYCCIISSCWSF